MKLQNAARCGIRTGKSRAGSTPECGVGPAAGHKMQLSHYNANRAFHLGCQSAFFEKLGEMVKADFAALSLSERLERTEAMLYYLGHAVEHGAMAGKAVNPEPVETAFSHFFQASTKRFGAVRAFLLCALESADAQHPLYHLLSQNEQGPAPVLLDYQQLSFDVLREVVSFFDAAGDQLQSMCRDLVSRLNAEEQARYEKARESVLKTMSADGGRPPKAVVQSVYPAL